MDFTNSTEAIISNQGDENTFINKILVEMKSQFNNPDIKVEPEEVKQESVDCSSLCDITANSLNEEKSENSDKSSKELLPNAANETIDNGDNPHKKEDNDSDSFKKPNGELSSISLTTSPNRRSLRHKSLNDQKSPEQTLKRSSRRRSKDCSESVLQNAIARKEKSYNEASKPQRLMRRLKPTQKILENLALAKEEKTKLLKSSKGAEEANSNNTLNNDSNLNENLNKRGRRPSRSPKKSKKIKANSDSEPDSDESLSDNSKSTTELNTSNRRSQRLSSRHREDHSTNSSPIIGDQAHNFPDDPECSVEEAQLSLVPTCFCTRKTNLFSTTNGETVYCNAVDSIADKLVGCTRIVNAEETPLLRPSQQIPYTLFCSFHRNRLLRHNCCPACGIFCTQGLFLECESKHHYHRGCQVMLGDVECCPHCGTTDSNEVYIKMHCSSKPIFLPTQKSNHPAAKMSFSSDNDESPCSTPLLLPIDTFQTFNMAQIDDQDFTSDDVLQAVNDSDINKLAAIIASNSIDLHFKIADFNDGTLMHYAASKGYVGVCHLLVSAGLEIDEFDKEQNTPLMLAISEGRDDVVQFLIKTGANIAVKGTDGISPLHVAAKQGNLRACRLLVEAGAVVDRRDDGGWTALTWACEHGHRPTAAYLLGAGADGRARDVEHNEPIHWAAFSGREDVVGLLLDKGGCDVNAVNAHGETPLHIAAREDRYNCTIVLLARGASISVLSKNNESPLDCVPDGGDCYGPIALNVKLQAIIGSGDRHKPLLCSDISRGREMNPIQCVNTVDDEPEPRDYIYITKNCITSNDVHIDTKLAILQSCTCEDRCTTEECECGKLCAKCWYTEDGRLQSDYNFSDPPMVFECNETCACNAITCKNRLVQKGVQQRFQLYKTEFKGWGVKTLRFIPKGSYVCEYVGEILTDVEANSRDEDSFLFDLDNKDVDSYCVDAKRYGNFARFINHSCSPNLHPVKVFIDHQDLRFPRIAFFALKDIAADEELSFDYGHKFWLVKYKSFTCQCGVDECKYSDETIGQALINYRRLMGEDETSQ
ncbi:unnamed protein product [Callosobruchus maculatus]|uniref:Histone-lysine N-methyltransferase n=1 Tax=Callosobruchus maculatus TaxID=64391 RepID=A0A653BM89_CALMS|nr:unnamed protein product [Callosobruchus maculatus]